MSPRVKKVTIGSRKIDEAALLGQLKSVQPRIQAWAASRGLWHDAGFLTPYLFHNEPPRRDQVLLLMMEQSLDWTIGSGGAEGARLGGEWAKLLEELGFWFELENHFTISLYPEADARMDEFLSLYRWRWLQHLAENKMVQLHGEVFEHFAKYPEDLQRIEWRQFEELLDAIFKNQGYYTELGKGRDDGGVDLRLYQNRAIPEIVTLAQAKRYKTPIKLDAVAALVGIAVEQRAPGAIFATTSYFQPKVRKYARSVEQRVDLPTVELADAGRLAQWCADISENLDRYFNDGIGAPPMITEQTGPMAGKIVVAQGGYNGTTNFFARIEADFPHEVIMRPIGQEIVSGDHTSGTVMPSETASVGWSCEARLLGMKKENGIWADRKTFVKWDGTPRYFNSD